MMEIPSQNITIYEYNKNETRMGWGTIVNHIGKHYPITFFVGVDASFKVKGVRVMHTEKIMVATFVSVDF